METNICGRYCKKKCVASFGGNGTNIAIWIACPKPGTGFPTSYVVVFI